jgi:RNA polymerase subunit RPABC4/transcription elongation factor Spt4
MESSKCKRCGKLIEEGNKSDYCKLCFRKEYSDNPQWWDWVEEHNAKEE